MLIINFLLQIPPRKVKDMVLEVSISSTVLRVSMVRTRKYRAHTNRIIVMQALLDFGRINSLRCRNLAIGLLRLNMDSKCRVHQVSHAGEGSISSWEAVVV